jgi:hypothetical protein
MTRVDESNEAQRVQAEQAQQQEQKTKTDGQEFARRMEGKQQPQPQPKVQQKPQQAQTSKGSSMLQARQGFANQMAGKLAQASRQLDEKQTKMKNADRSEDVDKQRTDTTETGDKTTNVRLDKQDKLGAIKRDDSNQGFQGGGGASMKDSDNAKDKMGVAQTANLGGAQGAQSTEGPQAAHSVQMPPEVLEKLVERLSTGVSAEGLSMFQIELKDSALKGASISVTAKDGKINMTVNTDDSNIRRLFQASEGQLSRALDHKGMSLESLVINQSK